MADPAYAGVGTLVTTINNPAPSGAPGLPSGTTEGDLILVVGACHLPTAAGFTWDTPAGFSLLAAADAPLPGSQVYQLRVWWKVAGPSESAPTVSGTPGSGNVFAWWTRVVRVTGFTTFSGSVDTAADYRTGSPLGPPVAHDGATAAPAREALKVWLVLWASDQQVPSPASPPGVTTRAAILDPGSISLRTRWFDKLGDTAEQITFAETADAWLSVGFALSIRRRGGRHLGLVRGSRGVG